MVAFLRAPPGSIGDDNVLYVIRSDGRGLRRLTPPGTGVWSYSWSPDARRIAYTDSRGSLWSVRADGTRNRLLMPSSVATSLNVIWSPDGTTLAVNAAGPDLSPRSTAVWKTRIEVLPAAGGSPRALPTGAGGVADFTWSPRGIAYQAQGGRIWLIADDGSKPTALTNGLPGATGFGSPTFSPDGSHLALGAGRYYQLWMLDVDRRKLHLITNHAYNEYGFAWSPDGRRLAYGREKEKGIYLVDPDGRDDHRLTRDYPVSNLLNRLSWSPDGRSIAYTSDRTGNGDIYLIAADGNHKPIQLTSSPEVDSDPSWAPR